MAHLSAVMGTVGGKCFFSATISAASPFLEERAVTEGLAAEKELLGGLVEARQEVFHLFFLMLF